MVALHFNPSTIEEMVITNCLNKNGNLYQYSSKFLREGCFFRNWASDPSFN